MPTSFNTDSRRYTIGWTRILCIDNDPDIHTNIELRMRTFAVEVEHSFYVRQGIVVAAGKCPDLNLTDLAMTNGDGMYLVETLRSNSETVSVPMIVFTGTRDPNLKARTQRDGADVYLQKPVPFDELLDEMGNFIALREREEETTSHNC